jgi:hypothetical protein
MRPKSTRIPKHRNRCHRTYSGKELPSARESWSGFEQASQAMNKTVEGILMGKCNSLNAWASMRLSCKLGSNEIGEYDIQYKKHDDPRISTLRGISIESSDDRRNAFDSIRINRESDSKEMDEIVCKIQNTTVPES